MNIHAIHALYASVVPPVPVSPHVAEILGRLQAERGPAQGDAEQNEIIPHMRAKTLLQLAEIVG